jgi:acyl-CoA reductase-like NAD-dependent aldehyde dehydrogenase
MFQQFQKMGFDPSKMMGEMGSKQNKGKVKSHIDRNRRKNIMSERLRKKLNNKNSEKNNIQNEVVENNDD